MNGIDFILDTNAIISLDLGKVGLKDFLNYDLAVSFITEIELLGYSGNSTSDLEDYKKLLAAVTILNINDAIKELTIDLRRTYKIKTPDAIIAATALYYNVALITNDNGFNKIDALVKISY